ncbi:MAG: DUF3153 domain-containing protein [Thainema sp.]
MRQWLNRGFLVHWRILGYAIALFCLTGCADYNIDIRFDHANHGVVTQQIHLSEQVADSPSVQDWVSSLKKQAHQFDGRVRQVSPVDWQIQVAFNNGADLQKKFNQLFQAELLTADLATPASSSGTLMPALSGIESHLRLQQHNYLVVVRNQLIYDLDLSSLGLRTATGELLLNSGSLLNLDIRLSSPWPLEVVDTGDVTGDIPQRQPGETGWSWSPRAGQPNHLEVVFWLPNPIGIGACAIALLVLVGYLLRPIFVRPIATQLPPSP